MAELRRLIEEYKQSLAMGQERSRHLEVKLSEMQIENEVALRRAKHAEEEVLKSRRQQQQHQFDMSYTQQTLKQVEKREQHFKK